LSTRVRWGYIMALINQTICFSPVVYHRRSYLLRSLDRSDLLAQWSWSVLADVLQSALSLGAGRALWSVFDRSFTCIFAFMAVFCLNRLQSSWSRPVNRWMLPQIAFRWRVALLCLICHRVVGHMWIHWARLCRQRRLNVRFPILPQIFVSNFS